jgi:hypothetical protein
MAGAAETEEAPAAKARAKTSRKGSGALGGAAGKGVAGKGGGGSVLPDTRRLTAGVRETGLLVPVDRLQWDYNCQHGQIRQLTDAHVREVKATLEAVPPTSYLPVTVVPADATGVYAFLDCACRLGAACAK